MVAFAQIAPTRSRPGFVHDAVGNTTTLPDPSSLANGLTLNYDLRNRGWPSFLAGSRSDKKDWGGRPDRKDAPLRTSFRLKSRRSGSV